MYAPKIDFLGVVTFSLPSHGIDAALITNVVPKRKERHAIGVMRPMTIDKKGERESKRK